MRRILRPLPLLAAMAACGTPPRTGPAPLPAPAAPTAGAAFAAAVDSIFNDTLFAGANWGVVVKSLETGQVLYERNARKMFVPASNMKLVTSSAVLETLGPDWHYRTPVVAAGTVANGVLRGDLVVVGSGDPTISADYTGGDPRAVFRAWADSLKAHGIRRITGRIVGNDDVFDDVPLGRGWAWDDLPDGYSAEVGGLEFNLGYATVVTRGTTPGAPAAVTVNPRTDYVPVRVTATTTPAGTRPDVTIVRDDPDAGITVTGTVPAGGADTTDVSVRDNTAYFAEVLRETLVASGIAVGGAALDQDTLPAAQRPVGGDTIFVHLSPAMRDILPGFLKPSQNQVGEQLLRTLGRAYRGDGSARGGIAVIDSVERTWGLPRGRLAQADGSGLSRYNLVAPELLIGVLEHMRRSPNFQTFYDALPVAGVDGTLASRMRGTPLQGNVHAKTGTVSNVRSLSGYLTTAAGEPMVFSMIVNHHTASSRDADRLAEAALLRLYALPRTR